MVGVLSLSGYDARSFAPLHALYKLCLALSYVPSMISTRRTTANTNDHHAPPTANYLCCKAVVVFVSADPSHDKNDAFSNLPTLACTTLFKRYHHNGLSLCLSLLMSENGRRGHQKHGCSASTCQKPKLGSSSQRDGTDLRSAKQSNTGEDLAYLS